MTKYKLLLVVNLIFLLFCQVAYCDNAVLSMEDNMQYEKKIGSLVEKNPDDVEIILGSADIFDLSPFVFRKNERLVSYEDVLNVDSANRIAWAKTLKNEMVVYLLEQENVKHAIKSVNSLWNGKTEIPTNSAIYNLAKTEEERKSLAMQQKESVLARKKKLEQSFVVLSEHLEKAKESDPDNAVYNYFWAQIYSVQGEMDKAVDEIKKGTSKPYVTFYAKERTKARQRVLEMVNYPWPAYGYVLVPRVNEFTFLSRFIREVLIPFAKQYEETDPVKAENLYNITISIADQLDKSTSFVPSKVSVFSIKAMGNEALSAFYLSAGNKTKGEACKENSSQAQAMASKIVKILSLKSAMDNSTEEFKSYMQEAAEKGEWDLVKENLE